MSPKIAKHRCIHGRCLHHTFTLKLFQEIMFFPALWDKFLINLFVLKEKTSFLIFQDVKVQFKNYHKVTYCRLLLYAPGPYYAMDAIACYSNICPSVSILSWAHVVKMRAVKNAGTSADTISVFPVNFGLVSLIDLIGTMSNCLRACLMVWALRCDGF